MKINIFFSVLLIIFVAGKNSYGKKLPESNVNGWILIGKNPGRYQSGTDSTETHSGKKSAFVFSKKKNNSSKWTTLMQMIKPGSYAGKRIRFTGWMKTKDVDGWAGFFMRVDKGNKSVAFDNMYDRPAKGNNDWKKYDIVLDVDSSANRIAFGIILGGNGKVWIDDIKLEVVDKSLALTDYNKINSLQNSNFEKPDQENKRPSSWFGTISHGYEITGDHSVFHGGKTSALLSAVDYTGKDKAPYGTITGETPADDFTGKRVKLSGWIKTENVSKAGIWMRIDGEKGKTLSFDNMSKHPVNGTNDWKEYSVVLDVPGDATGIYFGALNCGTGKLWLDDVSLTVVGNDIPSTSIIGYKQEKSKNDKSTVIKESKYDNAALLNANFEE